MAVKYSLAKMNTKLNGKSYEKVYAHAQVNETTSLKKFSQLIASQTTVSRADVSAVLISSVENLVMELQRGNQVEFGELGKFRLQLMSDGTDTASDFTSDNIKGVRIQFVPGDDLSDMFNQMEFTPVASRLVQKAALKAEKTVPLRWTSLRRRLRLARRTMLRQEKAARTTPEVVLRLEAHRLAAHRLALALRLVEALATQATETSRNINLIKERNDNDRKDQTDLE